jgi:hypothetical protein
METTKVKFRCGADPEVFLQNNAGKPTSVIGLIKADKWNPMQIPDMPKGRILGVWYSPRCISPRIHWVYQRRDAEKLGLLA